MKDFNNQKTVNLLRENRISVTLRMISILLIFIALVLIENKIYGTPMNDLYRTVMTALFVAIRLFLYIPFCVGVLRGIFHITEKKERFILCYFTDFKSYFGVVISAVFTVVLILFVLMFIFFLYALATAALGQNLFLDIIYCILLVSSGFYIVFKTVSALTFAFKNNTENFLKSYMTKLGQKSAVQCIKYLYPCVTRMLLIVFVFPVVYVLPFTLVRMSLRYK